jgi:hypothetical protein
MRKPFLRVLAAILLLTATACTTNTSVQINTPNTTIPLSMPGPNPLLNQPDPQGRVASSLAGLWHGFIPLATLVISLFAPGVQIYEGHNRGSEYNFDFFLGEAFLFALIGLFCAYEEVRGHECQEERWLGPGKSAKPYIFFSIMTISQEFTSDGYNRVV